MNVEIVDGRKASSFRNSTKVLVDIFRSTSTMPVMFSRGLVRILPTSSIKEARRLKAENPSYLLVGERYGMKVPGFDMNNSPQDAMEADLQGKSAIFTSTNGTLVLRKIASSGKIYVSSFINVSATLEKLKGEENVDIVVSNRPDGPADEDYIYAEYLRSLLLGESPDFLQYSEKIRRSKGARRLKFMGARRDIEGSLRKDLLKKALIFDGKHIITEE